MFTTSAYFESTLLMEGCAVSLVECQTLDRKVVGSTLTRGMMLCP